MTWIPILALGGGSFIAYNVVTGDKVGCDLNFFVCTCLRLSY